MNVFFCNFVVISKNMSRSFINILMFSVISAFLCMAPVHAKEGRAKKFTVVVDAGHGGKDFGAVDNKAKEKDINLGVALQLEKLVKKKLKDANIVMTRDDDTYLTLQQRADIANKAKGDLFISIHTNSVDKSNKNRKTVSGSSVYALGLHKDDNNMRVARRENSVIELEENFDQKYSGFDPSKDESYIIFEMAQKKNLSKSIRFAEQAQKKLVKSGRKDRGVHQAGFWVLWATSMPSVLIELDFICNPTSARYLNSDKGHKELATAIFNALEDYYESWLHSQGRVSDRRERDLSSTENTMREDNAIPSALADTDGNTPLVASSKAVVRTLDKAPARNVGGAYATARRRRRPESAKRSSSARNVETAFIPLHSDSERRGRIVEVAAEPEVHSDLVADDSSADKKSKNKKKDKKKKEKKEKKDKKKSRSSSHNAKIDRFVKVYKIQILASADMLKQNNPRFCGLTPVSTFKENNLYKYYYGESSDKKEIERMLREVRKKIPDAFVVSSMKSMNANKN